MELIFADREDLLNECLKIRNTVFIVEKGVPKELEIDEYDIQGGLCGHFLLKEKDNYIGAFRCMKLDKNTVKLQRFCFLKEYRGRGVGKQALEKFEEYLTECGIIKEIVLDAKFEVHGFYEKCGYEKVSGVFEEAGIPHIRMKKELP